jgi:hypothetical protein
MSLKLTIVQPLIIFRVAVVPQELNINAAFAKLKQQIIMLMTKTS